MTTKIKYWGFIFLICTAVRGQSLNTKQPNILWISVEDISPDLGCYGDKLAKTPVLDQLAKKGLDTRMRLPPHRFVHRLEIQLLQECTQLQQEVQT